MIGERCLNGTENNIDCKPKAYKIFFFSPFQAMAYNIILITTTINKQAYMVLYLVKEHQARISLKGFGKKILLQSQTMDALKKFLARISEQLVYHKR